MAATIADHLTADASTPFILLPSLSGIPIGWMPQIGISTEIQTVRDLWEIYKDTQTKLFVSIYGNEIVSIFKFQYNEKKDFTCLFCYMIDYLLYYIFSHSVSTVRSFSEKFIETFNQIASQKNSNMKEEFAWVHFYSLILISNDLGNHILCVESWSNSHCLLILCEISIHFTKGKLAEVIQKVIRSILLILFVVLFTINHWICIIRALTANFEV